MIFNELMLTLLSLLSLALLPEASDDMSVLKLQIGIVIIAFTFISCLANVCFLVYHIFMV